MFWIPAKDAAVPNMLRKDQLEPANQLSLVTTYGLTPVLAAIVFALLNSTGGRLRVAVPGGRPGRRRALPQRPDLPRRRDRHLEPALDQRPAGTRRRHRAGELPRLAAARLLLRRAHPAGPGPGRRHHRRLRRGGRDHRDRPGVRERARGRPGRLRAAVRRRLHRPGPGHRAGPERGARPGPRAHLRPGHRGRRRDGRDHVLDVDAVVRPRPRRPHGLLRGHRLPGRLHAAGHRGRRTRCAAAPSRSCSRWSGRR